MLPIGNKPLISYQLESLERKGFQDIIVAMQANNALRTYLEKEFVSKLSVSIVETDELIHNIDVLHYLSHRIVKNFLIVPCDLVTNLDLDSILQQHILSDSLISCVLREDTPVKGEESSDYDLVMLDETSDSLVDIQSAPELIEEGEGISIKQ